MSNTYEAVIKNSEIKCVTVSLAQNQGRRDYQEDSADFFGEKGSVGAVVADGMGGMKNGKELSSSVIEKLLAGMKKFSADVPVYNQFGAIIDEISASVAGGESGSTVCAVYCCSKGVFWYSVGDSRLYLISNGKICRMTEDGDYFNMLLGRVLNGELTLESADTDPQRDYLFQYIGAEKKLSPDFNIRPLIPKAGDSLLICSDGVYNALSDKELEEIVSEGSENSARNIAERVMDKNIPTQDNLTALVMRFD